MTFGARHEIELDGREYTAWEDVDGLIGAIEVDLPYDGSSILVQTREIWKRGEPLGPEIKKVVEAIGIRHLMPRPRGPLPARRRYPFPPR